MFIFWIYLLNSQKSDIQEKTKQIGFTYYYI